MSEQTNNQNTSTWVIDQINGEWATLHSSASSDAEGRALSLPSALLPHGAHEGAVIHLSLSVDVGETERARAEVSAIIDELMSDDDGADFDL